MFGWSLITTRELAYLQARIQEVERQNLHLLNCALTKHDNYAIPLAAPVVPVVIEEPKPQEMVQGQTKDEFVAFEIESGYKRHEAEEMWGRCLETGLLPWQWDVPPFAQAEEVVEQ
jgi:hypothetical protein